MTALKVRNGASCRIWPFIRTFAVQICLISLGNQANPSLSNHIFFYSFGVRFGVRKLGELNGGKPDQYGGASRLKP
jgi:hypothetical protein